MREVPASRLRVSRRALVIAGAAHAKELHNFIFYCYIHVLVKTNTMIYNMLYKLCVLAVSDDKLGMGDDDDA